MENQGNNEKNPACAPGVRPDVLNYDDIRRMVPALDGHKKLVETVMHWLMIDEVNRVHARNCHATGVKFARELVESDFKFKLRVDNEEILDRFPAGSFITVSNHPYGGMDGIILLHLVGRHRPDFQVMVNMFLNNITAMREAFIGVDAIQTNDPKKKAVTMQGIRHAIARVREGHPLGFFPAGAVSKYYPFKKRKINDRDWQPNISRLIAQLKVPVIPIYFHGHNSAVFNILGLIDWRLRSARLPRELFNMRGTEVHISVGEPVAPEEYLQYNTPETLGEFLKEKTYSLSAVR